ncbi:LexA family transcriptional regulator [Moraxella catarrhalis]|uniref:LexA family transcriptional regulator n=1 Tax=Moraxella catarrhalis TaxID=480 RepID=UPI0009C29E97|nr:helix-turn-helix transcriptional regulator [Moraxella catarrhalis]ARE65437.1 hypothetical protein MC195_01175 [Moraxella catarrhalis]MPX23100.1 peptidase S24 [Moraxella catarrhalis]RKL74605.1 helix-turn-helix transcriptional regulator [Moraxella catarrhalis]
MSSLVQNLEYLMKKQGLSANQLQEKTGVTQSTTSRILSGETKNPRADALKKYADYFGVSVIDLQYSNLAVESNISPNFESVDDWGNDTPLEPDEVEIPFYKDFSVACGHGTDLVVMENEKRRLRFSRLTLDRIGSHKDKVFATLAEGDSMSPTINDKDTIWIDESKTSIKDGKIFVFEYGGLCMCKRLYRLPNNGLKIVSDNTIDYPEWEITGEQKETNGFRLIGWVFHWSVMDSW